MLDDPTPTFYAGFISVSMITDFYKISNKICAAKLFPLFLTFSQIRTFFRPDLNNKENVSIDKKPIVSRALLIISEIGTFVLLIR